MLTFDEAKIIGIKACIEKIGKDFYEKYKSFSVYGYGDYSDEGVTFCYVGVATEPLENDSPNHLCQGAKKDCKLPHQNYT